MRRLFPVFLALALVAASPSQAQLTSEYAKAAKPGDDKLSCEQIMAEGKEAERQATELSSGELPPDVDARVRATAKAGGAAAAALGIAAMASSLLPGSSNVANAAISQGFAISGKATQMSMMSQVRAAQAQQEVVFSAALDRMSYLQALYQQKCR